MAKSKMIAKGCPKCDQQVPVACKACPCGHSFFNSRRTNRVLSPSAEFRRRTQRVRREKPNYYDALEYDKKNRKPKQRIATEEENEDDPKGNKEGKIKRKKIKKEDEDDDELISSLSNEKQVQCSLILEELNRKMQVVTWSPPV